MYILEYWWGWGWRWEKVAGDRSLPDSCLEKPKGRRLLGTTASDGRMKTETLWEGFMLPNFAEERWWHGCVVFPVNLVEAEETTRSVSFWKAPVLEDFPPELTERDLHIHTHMHISLRVHLLGGVGIPVVWQSHSHAKKVGVEGIS
jgi:hypothetical protein